MIKKLVFVTIALGFALSMQAQTKQLEIGIVAGHGHTSLRGTTPVEEASRVLTIRPTAGLSIRYNLNNKFSLGSNISYERRGYLFSLDELMDLNGNNFDGNEGNNLDYITVPLLVRYSFGKGARFFINAGPYFSYLFKATSILKDVEGIPDFEDDLFPTETLNRFDTGISTGIGVKFPIRENLKLTIEARNNFGLYNINALEEFSGQEIFHNTTSLLLGLSYSFGEHI